MLDSSKLKAAVMSYFRFERKGISATEVTYSDVSGPSDVLVDTGDEIIEVEVKVDKVDLEEFESKKLKHETFKNITGDTIKKVPNRFYFCVPQYLQNVTQEFIERVNSGYGLILFDSRAKKIDSRTVRIVKHAKKLHEYYNQQMKEAIVLRLCSEVANMYEKKANGEWDEARGTSKKKHKRKQTDSTPVSRDNLIKPLREKKERPASTRIVSIS